MATRKKEKQLGLGETPVRPAPVQTSALAEPVPAMVEYNHGTELWCCKRFDLLVAELPGITVAALPQLQAALELQDRQWLIARRVFGLMPVVASPRVALDDLRVWTPLELGALLGLKNDQWQQELAAIRGVWLAIAKTQAAEAPAAVPSAPAPSGLFADDDLVKKYDFGRIRFRDSHEMARFVERLREVEKLFVEKATSGLVRNLLNTELQIGRLDEELAKQDYLGKDWRDNMKLLGDMREDYGKQLKLIDTLAPWFGAIAGKYSFKGTLAEVSQAIREYHASGDTALVDGIFTATEIQVECRRSVQAPEPRYRLGWVVHALEAKANLWNPNWKNTTPLTVLKKMDKAMKEALKAAGQESGEAVPDLEKDGPDGEYPKILTAADMPPINPPQP